MIYLDHAATTPICDAAKKAVVEALDYFGNPSSSYEFARESRALIQDARERIANCINAEPDEIYFTSGGSEANTWALNSHNAVSTDIEHHSVRTDRTIGVNRNGVIWPQSFTSVNQWINSIVSCMYVNNEIGTIQPIKEIAEIVHSKKMYLHTDAVQAVGHIPVDVKDLDCDMLSASGHKFGALKGTGFLYIKNNSIEIDPLIKGGKQENGMRPGTENILGIVSMAVALEDAVLHMEERETYVRSLRSRMLNKLLSIDSAYLNGSYEHRVASNINMRFNGVVGSRLVSLCDLYGVCISSGSACNEGVLEPSHVLQAIGLTNEEALSSVRITLGYENTQAEIDVATDIITKMVERIRECGQNN